MRNKSSNEITTLNKVRKIKGLHCRFCFPAHLVTRKGFAEKCALRRAAFTSLYKQYFQCPLQRSNGIRGDARPTGQPICNSACFQRSQASAVHFECCEGYKRHRSLDAQQETEVFRQSQTYMLAKRRYAINSIFFICSSPYSLLIMHCDKVLDPYISLNIKLPILNIS